MRHELVTNCDGLPAVIRYCSVLQAVFQEIELKSKKWIFKSYRIRFTKSGDNG